MDIGLDTEIAGYSKIIMAKIELIKERKEVGGA